MTGTTHRQYSVSGALIAAIIMYKYSLSEINYYFALPILLMTAKYGALFPDVDHDWKNVKDKTVPNWIINKFIHLTGGRHRSWQTHSIDIVVIVTIVTYYLPSILYEKNIISNVNKEVLVIILTGFTSGWISHIISDMMTSGAVRLVCFMKIKVKLVPKKIGKLKFKTGEEWEAFNYKVIKFINIPLGLTCIIYPYINSGQLKILIHYIKNLIRG